MSAFEMMFTLLGLLLGLAIAEILGGLSRAVRLRRTAKPVRIGWLTPLLGTFVMLDLTRFWLEAWSVRDQLLVDYPSLVGILLIVGIYYLAATLIFPDDPEEWPDYDAWYEGQNRIVLGGMVVANVAASLGMLALEAASGAPAEQRLMSEEALMVGDFAILVTLALLVALIVVKSRRAKAVLLATLIALHLLVGVVDHII
ncbi:hypothetical protein [Sphingosinicella sp.]|uniref:hypothetical protein n=1 Tax=Sphingosinicella sp. TaxID=1917971 RepID=UPI004037BC79